MASLLNNLNTHGKNFRRLTGVYEREFNTILVVFDRLCIQEKPTYIRKVFIGHSIGAWITKELVKKFQKELKPIPFLLFPFIAKSLIRARCFTNSSVEKHQGVQ